MMVIFVVSACLSQAASAQSVSHDLNSINFDQNRHITMTNTTMALSSAERQAIIAEIKKSTVASSQLFAGLAR